MLRIRRAGSLSFWQQTWHAPCDDVTTRGKEFRKFEIPKDTIDRLQSAAVQPAKRGNAMRVEVLHGDIAWNPDTRTPISGGWRAEASQPAQGPYLEFQGDTPIRYEWSTMLDPGYPTDPRVHYPDPNHPKHADHRRRIWQVIFQWHQSGDDVGGSPSIGFIIWDGYIRLTVHRHDPNDETTSIHVGRWPIAPMARGTWHDFAAEIKWHLTDGSIKVWHNGSPVIFNPQTPDSPGEPDYPTAPTDTLTNLGTLYPHKKRPPNAPPPLNPPLMYLKVGLYRRADTTEPAGPFRLYHDEIARYTLRTIRMPLIPMHLRLPRLRWPRRVLRSP
ncbi:heparin lyase I family protein [Geodermatophilus sp. URMC 60]